MRIAVLGALVVTFGMALPAHAQSPAGAAAGSDGFPPDAQQLAPDALHKRLAGKAYTYRAGSGTVRLDFRDNGFVFLNTSGGMNSSGPWRTQESSLCSEIRNVPQGCAPVRQSGERLFLKRPNGEVVELLPG